MGRSALVSAEGAGADPGKGARAALVDPSASCTLKLRLIRARHPDKRAPAKNPFESGPEPANQVQTCRVYAEERRARFRG